MKAKTIEELRKEFVDRTGVEPKDNKTAYYQFLEQKLLQPEPIVSEPKQSDEVTQKLFDYLLDNHDMVLISSDLNEVCKIVLGDEEYINFSNWKLSEPNPVKEPSKGETNCPTCGAICEIGGDGTDKGSTHFYVPKSTGKLNKEPSKGAEDKIKLIEKFCKENGITPFTESFDWSIFADWLINAQLNKPTITEPKQEDEHKCKYCGVMTTQPDEDCYKNPNTEPKQVTDGMIEEMALKEYPEKWKPSKKKIADRNYDYDVTFPKRYAYMRGIEKGLSLQNKEEFEKGYSKGYLDAQSEACKEAATLLNKIFTKPE